MAYKTFQNGFPLPASDLNNFLMKQSVIVFANVAARTAALPEPVEGMVTYLEDDNELYKWTGADWVNVAPAPDLSSVIPKSTVTTAGDLIVADGASSVTRLGAGANGSIITVSSGTPSYLAPGTDDQVLTLVSGAPAWADPSGGGGSTWTSISSGSITTGSTTFSLSSLPAYDKYLVLIDEISSTSGSYPSFFFRVNSDSGNNYSFVGLEIETGGSTMNRSELTTNTFRAGNGGASAANDLGISFLLEGCQSATAKKSSVISVSNYVAISDMGIWNNTASVTSIQITTGSGTIDAGSYKLFGGN